MKLNFHIWKSHKFAKLRQIVPPFFYEMIRPRAQRGKCWIWNSQAYSNVFFENRQFSPKSGLGTLMFRYDTGRHIWSGCISLHQAPRISCPLDLVVRICLCGECFSLLQSTQLEGDRAARGHSLWIEKRKEDRMNKQKERTNDMDKQIKKARTT